MKVLVGGEEIAAEITAPHEIPPGQRGTAGIAFAKPVRAGEGGRFLLLRDGRGIATGYFLGEGDEDPSRRLTAKQ